MIKPRDYMFGYIYKTTNLINGRIYIGQRQGSFMPSYLGSGVILNQAINKYGKENFKLEVIGYASTKPMLDGLEMKHIFEHRHVFGKEFLYNVSDGGEGCLGYKHSPEVRKLMNKNRVGMPMPDIVCLKISKNNARYWQGKKRGPHSSEIKEKIKLGNIGIPKPKSKEWAKKHSIAMTGKPSPKKGKHYGFIPPNKGKKGVSLETSLKMKEARRLYFERKKFVVI